MKTPDKKNKNPNLIWIDKPSVSENGTKNSLQVAYKVLSMLTDDFNLTISDICNIFSCERKWVENNIKPNVKHIFLNSPFRIFLKKTALLNNIEIDEISLKDYYYFSRKDFYLWLRKNIKIYRQTIVIDLMKFSNNISKFESIKTSYLCELNKDNSSIQKHYLKLKFKADISETLTEKGKELFEEVNPAKRNCEFIDVTNTEEIPNSLISIKDLKGISQYSNELIYRNLYSHGALKYIIADSLVRYDADYISKSIPRTSNYLITIPYSLYIKSQ